MVGHYTLDLPTQFSVPLLEYSFIVVICLFIVGGIVSLKRYAWVLTPCISEHDLLWKQSLKI